MSSAAGQRADGFDQPADFVVDLGGERGEDLHLPRHHLLLFRGKRVPGWDLLRAFGELGILRDHAVFVIVGSGQVPLISASSGQ